jgi:hypothetical protein
VSHVFSSDCCTVPVLEIPDGEPVDELHGRVSSCPECGATGSFHVGDEDGSVYVQWKSYPENVQTPETLALWREGEKP